jgi:hypothetical protein
VDVVGATGAREIIADVEAITHVKLHKLWIAPCFESAGPTGRFIKVVEISRNEIATNWCLSNSC